MKAKREKPPTKPPQVILPPAGILVDVDILGAFQRGEIVIDPFDPKSLGTNSYDVHLAPTLMTYQEEITPDGYGVIPMDVSLPRVTKLHKIPSAGFVLKPFELYLASTTEYTESHRHVPILNGKSSLGRLGLSIHITAGTGDVGFCNHWTLEMTVIKPLRIFAGMAIGQLLWFAPSNEPAVRYMGKAGAKYAKRDPLPQASESWRNFDSSESIKRIRKA
jgi:dCTP deaminase